MSERLLAVLLQQALLLSLGALLVGALRPLLLERLGAGSVYAAWLLVPALLLTPLLPRPAQEPLLVVLQAAGTAKTAAMPALPAAAPGHAALGLALWLGGAALVIAVQAWRQWRLGRLNLQLPAGSSPALVGLLRPCVALPIDFESRFSAAERQLILAHEEVHRSRGDNAWNLLACLLTALHWWNPLAWWAARRMQADQELACDAAVLSRHPAGRLVYTQALLAAHGLQPPRAPLASRWGSTHPLVERIAMLNRAQPLPRRRAAVLGLALLGVVGLAYAAQGAAPVPAEDGFVDIRMTMTLSNGESRSPRLVTQLGVPATIEWGWDTPGASGGWGMVMTVTREADGRLRTLTTYREGYPLKPVEGSHTALGNSGDSIELLRGSQTGGPDLKLSRTVTLLPPGFKMPPQESKPRS